MSVEHLDSCDCCDSLWLLTQLTPCGCQGCIVEERQAAVRAATIQPESERSESRRGFLRRDEENPCDGAEDIWWRFCKLHWAQQLGFCVGSIYILSVGNQMIGLNHTCHICHLYHSIHPKDYRFRYPMPMPMPQCTSDISCVKRFCPSRPLLRPWFELIQDGWR